MSIVILVVMTWPTAFVPEGRELTGRGIGLVATFDSGSRRQGVAAWVYRLSEGDADALDGDRDRLRRYPMWSAPAFDGYQRVHWQSLEELRGGEHGVVADGVFAGDVAARDVTTVGDVVAARALARWLARQDGAMVAGWYTESGGTLTNYFLYVLEPKRRLLVKLSLLT